MDDAVEERIELVAKRTGVMRALAGGWLDPRSVEERTGASRSTVNRALRSLEGAGLATREAGEYTLTPVGRLALAHYRDYRRGWEDLVGAGDVLSALPAETDLPMAVVEGCEPVAAPSEAPFRPLQRLLATVEDADRYRALLPAVDDPKQVRLLYEHVVTDGDPATLVVGPELRRSLAEQFPQRLAGMAGADGFELLVGEPPAYGLLLTDHDGGARATVVVYGGEGRIAGLLENDAEAAVRWARERFEAARADAEDVTDEYRRPADGGVATVGSGVRTGPGVSVALERQGFVRLDRSFLLGRAVADPATAWRAGLDVAEVHTGYAIARKRDGTVLSDRLLDALADGEDCVLVGSPGSGKSTTAKRVACRWYAEDRGPVFYRASDRGTALAAVDELVATVEAAPGHALVVVEDAVRPDADAVFGALSTLADRPDVSVLLDARESEWRDPPGEAPVGAVDLRVEAMPRLGEDGYERLVERFETTAGTSVEVPAERLRSAVAESLPDGDAAAGPGEVLLATHRLAQHAGGLSEGPTTLEEDAAACYESAVEAGETALDVALAANLLNAAGVAFGPAHLRAVADAGGAGGDGDAALDVLEGRVTFGREDGTYRTVHETWSVAFLEAVLDREGEAAARERVGRSVSAVLALADDAGARERAAATGEAGPLDRIDADPAGWADGVVESLFALARERPKVAPLLGDESGPALALPAACERVSPADCTAWLGRAFVNEGANERALATFERLPEDGPRAVDRWLGTSSAAAALGETDRAVADAERALDLARERDDDAAVARARTRLGEVFESTGQYDRAIEEFERALELARERGQRRTEGDVHHALGNVALFRGDYDRASERYEAALECRRAVGDRRGESKTVANLGAVALYSSDYDRGREYFEQSLAIAREIGDRRSESVNLANLGNVAQERGDYRRAREYYEAALEIQSSLGNRQKEANSLGSLGTIVHDLGDHEQGRAYLERALEIRRDIDDRRGVSISLYYLGNAARDRGNYQQAREYFRESREVAEEIGDSEGVVAARFGLGQVARETGDYGAAEEYLEGALESFEAFETEDRIADARAELGRLACDRGEYDDAREHLTAALSVLGEMDTVRDALGVLEALVDVERAAGDEDAAREWCERALARIDDAGFDLPDRREAFEGLLAEIDDPE